MQYFTLLSSIILYINWSNAAAPIRPCNSDDTNCLISTANAVYQQFIMGIPDLGIEPQEPMFQPLIVGNLTMLQFKLINTTFTGMNNCKITDFKLDPSALSLHLKMSCGVVTMNGLYELSGKLMVMPVEGSGECAVVAEGYDVIFNGTYKLETGRMTIKTYVVQADATRKVTFKFQNLFNGQKEQSDAVHHFVNTNWKEVADLMEQPAWNAHAMLLVNTANKYLRAVQI